MRWPAGVGGQGNEGVAGQVKQTPGSIGYVEADVRAPEPAARPPCCAIAPASSSARRRRASPPPRPAAPRRCRRRRTTASRSSMRRAARATPSRPSPGCCSTRRHATARRPMRSCSSCAGRSATVDGWPRSWATCRCRRTWRAASTRGSPRCASRADQRPPAPADRAPGGDPHAAPRRCWRSRLPNRHRRMRAVHPAAARPRRMGAHARCAAGPAALRWRAADVRRVGSGAHALRRRAGAGRDADHVAPRAADRHADGARGRDLHGGAGAALAGASAGRDRGPARQRSRHRLRAVGAARARAGAARGRHALPARHAGAGRARRSSPAPRTGRRCSLPRSCSR